MNKNIQKLFFGVLFVVGILIAPVYADLGLAQILSDQGVQAVGSAVKEATEAVYAGTDDAEQIKIQLVAILNEAVATGNEGVMRYAIVAVMMVGGAENVDLSKDAINNSELFVDHPKLAAETIVKAEKLIRSGGGTGDLGGEKLGGGEGGGGENEQGGGKESIFDDGTDDGDIDDHDRDATQV